MQRRTFPADVGPYSSPHSRPRIAHDVVRCGTSYGEVAFGYENRTVGNGAGRGLVHQRDARKSLTVHADGRDPDP
jgi:hypothetical protein